jgi:[ribosomal protein S18]-alanine N-acetyltransferase
MALVVRKLLRQDLDEVLRLERATPEAPHWVASVYESFLVDQPEGLFFIAEFSGGLAGFVAGQAIMDECELQSIVVKPAARRMGIGKALLAYFIDDVQQRHISHIFLEVRSGNRTAISLYEQTGFRRTGTRRGYYRDPDDDAQLMDLSLTSNGEL